MRLPVLVVHICAGIIALLSGATAMSFRKGAHAHRVAGNVFVVAMLTMSTAAIYLAFMKSQVSNVLGGVLAFYLVATAWATARHKDGETGLFDWAALLVALAVGASQLAFGVEAMLSPTRLKYGYNAGLYFSLGCVLLLAAAGDLRLLVRGGVLGARRITRHLWRMCVALFIATGSFFLGQQQVLPIFLRNTTLLFVLRLLPLGLLVFWLVRVRFTAAYKRRLAPGYQT